MAIKQFPLEKEYEKIHKMERGDIVIIREWLIQQPHLPNKYITDFEIILAYHCCECNIELTKQVIDLNYTLRTMFSFYSNREINKSLEVAVHTWLMTPLITPCTNGNQVVYCHLIDEDANKFVYSDVVRAFVMIMDLWQFEVGTVPGVVLIVNMDKVTLTHVTRINIQVAQEFFYFLQEAMFIRLKEFHFINAPAFMDNFLNMIKPFMKKATLDLLKVHRIGSNTLEQHISLTALPKEVGGNYRTCFELRDKIWRKLKANNTFFEEESKKRVDESKRPEGPKNISSIFPGLEGTFKNLVID